MREHVNVARDLYNEPKQSGCGEMGGWGGGSVIFPKVKKKIEPRAHPRPD